MSCWILLGEACNNRETYLTRSTKKESMYETLFFGFILYSERDLNPHNRIWSQDFKSCVSTDSTIRADLNFYGNFPEHKSTTFSSESKYFSAFIDLVASTGKRKFTLFPNNTVTVATNPIKACPSTIGITNREKALIFLSKISSASRYGI